MKNTIKYFLLLPILALGACSLDMPQKDYILDDDVVDNVHDVELVVIGTYGRMPVYGQMSVSTRISDDNRLSDVNRGEGKQIHTWSINAGTDEAEGNWSGRFRPILSVNKLFEIVHTVKPLNQEEEIVLNQCLAEAYAIRAYMHFELFRLFGDYTNLDSKYGIPYVVKSGIHTPSRLNVADTYDAIEADLLMAYELMPESFHDKYRFTKDAVVAMLARLYLYKQDYANAITYSSMLIDKWDLNSIDTYEELWTDQDLTEVIFAHKKVPGDNAIGTVFTARNGDISYHPSYSIINAVSENETDVRNKVIYYTDNKGELAVAKYLGTETNPYLNHVKIFRLSEQYLIRAEAYARTGKFSDAAADYNKLRENRIADYKAVIFNSQSIALDYILNERRIELAFEGHRWFDLRRYNRGISRLDEDVTLIPEYQELSADDARMRYLPIPQSEIFANDNMEQNDGF